ncbi:MAG: hypothetical protein NC222_05275 [Staphylococcus sp.]|nr:hypothetical protein [Staphylococcus sp.]
MSNETFKMIVLGIDILVLFIGLIVLLKGFMKGTLRTGIIVAIQIVPLILCFIFAGRGAQKVIHTENHIFTEEETSLYAWVEENVANQCFEGDINKLKEAKMDILIEDMAISVGRFIICLSFAIVWLLIGAPLLRLIFFLVLPGIRKKKHRLLLDRLLGLGIAFVGFIFMFYTFVLPLYGAVEVTQQALEEVAKQDESYVEQSENFNEIVSSSFILKTTKTLGKKENRSFGLAAKRLGKVFQIKTNGVTINFVKEIDALSPMLPRVLGIVEGASQDISNNEKLDLLTEEDIHLLCTYLGDSKIIKAFYPYIIGYLQTEQEKLDIQKWNLDFDRLSQLDINQNFSETEPFLKSVYQMLQHINLDDFKTEQLLASDTFATDFSDALTKAMKVELFEECFTKVSYFYLQDYLKETEYAFVTDWINEIYIQTYLASDVKEVVSAYQLLKETKVLDYIRKVEGTYTFTNELKSQLQEAKRHILSVYLLKDNYPSILEKMAYQIQKSFDISEYGIDIDAFVKEEVDWSKETEVLLDICIDIYELVVTCPFDQNDLSKLLEHEHTASIIQTIVEDLNRSTLAKSYYLPAVIEMLQKATRDSGLESIVDLIQVDYLQQDFSTDVEALFTAYRIAQEIQLKDHFDTNQAYQLDLTDEKTKAQVEQLLDCLLGLQLLQKNEQQLVQIFLDMSGMNQYMSYIAPNTPTDWNEEQPRLKQVLLDIIDLSTDLSFLEQDISTLDNALDIAEKVGGFFDDMYVSHIMQPYTFTLLDIILQQTGFTVLFTGQEKEIMMQHTMTQELGVLVSVLTNSKNIFLKDTATGQIQTGDIQGSEVEQIMMQSSTSILASKVIGQLLNDALGEKGMNILPIDNITHQPQYDFTRPELLQMYAQTMGRMIDIAQAIHDTDKNHITDETVQRLSTAFSALDQIENHTDLTYAMLSQVVGNEGLEIDENVDWTKEATTLTSALTTYQEALNQQKEFNIQDYPELATQVEESAVITAVLTYLEIL